MIIGLYARGNSFLHKLDPRLKLTLLFVSSFIVLLISNIWFPIVSSLILFLLFRFTNGLSLGLLLKTSRPLFLWLIFIFIFQIYVNGIYIAISISFKILSLVWLASLITFTSKVDEMSEAFIFFFSWLKYFGYSLKKMGFILALSLRMIPFIFKVYEDIKDVYSARGVSSNILHLLPIVLIRIIRDANSIGLVLNSRGYESWGDK